MAKKITAATFDKYKSVIDEYFVNGFNGGGAYQKIYTKSKKESSRANFIRIKEFPQVKEYIKQKQNEAAKIIDITRDGILKELKNWIESDITDTIGLTPAQVKKLPIGLRRLITKYKQTNKEYYNSEGAIINTVSTIELHFVSKERAIEMINKHIGFYEEDNKQKMDKTDLSKLSTEELLMRAELINKISKVG